MEGREFNSRVFDGAAIRTDLLAFLTTPGFTHFEPADVADYTELGQIWVKTTYDGGTRERDLIFAYDVPVMTIEDRSNLLSIDPPPTVFSDEVATVSAKFGEFGDTHSTVVPIRNRFVGPQPPHTRTPLS